MASHMKCTNCEANLIKSLIPYAMDTSEIGFGNCSHCGAFISVVNNSQSIKLKDDHFQFEDPMDVLLNRMIE